MRLVKKKRKLTKLTKRFLGYTFITLILILGCLLSYPKLEIKDNKQKERIYILYNEVEINM